MTNSEQRKGWTKTDGEDASRLLAELAKRSEKASGGLKRPEQIQQSGEVPRKPEKMPPERANREAAQHPGAAFTSSLGGGSVGRGAVIAANDNDGQVYRGAVISGVSRQTARPLRDELAGSTDRAYRRSRIDS